MKRALPFLLFFFLFFSVPGEAHALESLQNNFSVTYPIGILEPSPGDIIIRDRYTNVFRRSRFENDPNVFGVVSQDPVLVFRTDNESVPVIRFGQTPVNVVLEEGGIAVGDNITTSSVLGHGRVARPHHRYIVGVALESLDVDDTDEVVLTADGEEVPAGEVWVDLRIGPSGSGVTTVIPGSEFVDPGEVDRTMDLGDMFSEDMRLAGEVGRGAVEGTRELLQTAEGELISRIVSGGGVIVGMTSALSSLFLNPVLIAELFLLPFRLWALTRSFFGFRRKVRSWGTVYDSITKQPLDPVYVALTDEEGNDVTEAITDIDGRYGFVVEPGRYKMTANKTNYAFPSEKLSGKTRDDLYEDLYFGEVFEVTEGDSVVAKNIPMDPVDFDWNEFAKMDQGLLTYFSYADVFKGAIFKWLFYVGFVVAVVALFLVPHPYNVVIVALYVLVFFLRMIGFKPRRHGKVIEADSKAPLPFAVVRVFSVRTQKESAKAVCDKHGRYFVLLSDGKYYVRIDRKVGEDEYETAHTSETLTIKNGILKRTFKV